VQQRLRQANHQVIRRGQEVPLSLTLREIGGLGVPVDARRRNRSRRGRQCFEKALVWSCLRLEKGARYHFRFVQICICVPSHTQIAFSCSWCWEKMFARVGPTLMRLRQIRLN
jgi:hypothetical protein